MTKDELIEEISKIGVKKKDTQAVMKSFIATVLEVMSQGGTVHLKGFGTFSSKEYAARKGRNPATGEVIDIHRKVKPVFSPSTAMKAACLK